MKQNTLILSLLCLFALPILLLNTGCISLTNTNRKAFVLMNKSTMHNMGKDEYVKLKQKEKLLSQGNIVDIVRKVGMRIAQASGKKYQWEFSVFDSPKNVNAFCLPGGKIGIYTGILPIAQTEAGLAAIMGHEVAHATLRHGAERMSQAMASKAGLTLAGLLLNKSRYQNVILGALGVGTKFGVMLPYGRKHESEADHVGLIYMAKAGYHPNAAVGLWKRMAQLGNNTPEFLSTHPHPTKRAQELLQQQSRVMPQYQKSQKQAELTLPL